LTGDLVSPRPGGRPAPRWSSGSSRRPSGRALVAAALIAAGCSSAPKQLLPRPAKGQVLAYRGPDGVWKDETGEVAMPVVTHHVNPLVPPYRGDAVSGAVELKARVSDEGVVEEVVVIKSLSRAMDQEAITAVRQWRYRPATLAGQPVEVWLRVTVTYHFTG
jgi:TonB family protein